jgi:hypothetical protein
MGVTPGWPDLLFVGPNKCALWLELKKKGGKLSESQIEMRDHLIKCGFAHLTTDSFEQAVYWLKKHGALRVNVNVQ